LQSTLTHEVTLALCVAALGAAYVSWRYVEQPFRARGYLSQRFVFANAALVALTVTSFGLVGYFTAGLPSRLPTEANAIAAWATYQVPRTSECFGDVEVFIHPDRSCIYNAPLEANIAIWGDSHVAAISSALGDALRAENQGLRQFSFSGCPPIEGIHFIDKDRYLCPTYNSAVASYVRSHHEISTIILFARWPVYMNGYRYDNGEGGISSESSAVI
jgi:hypothetical protein